MTVACALPAKALTPSGAFGRVAGVTADVGVDAALVPTAFVAVTVNVYAMPLVSPLTTHPVAGTVPVHVKKPGEDVTVYPVIAVPPLNAGAVHVTVACAFPAVGVGAVGAFGTVAGVTAAEATDGALSPTMLVAFTVNV